MILHRRELFLRTAALLAMAVAALLLRAVDPGSVSFLPFRTSCGAASGLPCIFCGTTRAMHHLLQGDFAGALYFNWLAFPVAAFVGGFALKLAAEVLQRRRIVLPLPSVKLSPQLLAAGMTGLVALWLVQVTLAVVLHKHELLNPSGPLYPLFVR